MNELKLLNYTITLSLDEIIPDGDQIIINTINPHCYCQAKHDQPYRESLQRANYLLPDGIGIVWAARVLEKKKIIRITGYDLHQHLLNKLNRTGGKVFYLGASPSTLLKIESLVKRDYPNLLVASYSPPFKPEFTDEENNDIIAAVNSFNPSLLFIGLTAPKQEKWSALHKDQLNVPVIACIGAVFDFYAQTVIRPGQLWQRLGLEWLPRLIREPKRLWRRNLISTPLFIWYVLIARIKK